ncbi:MAG: hypothetical protein RL670_488 [Actinomycetota bacterium]
MTQKRWWFAGALLAVVALVAGLLFWSSSMGKPIRGNQVNLTIGVSQKDAVLNDLEIVTVHAFTPRKVRSRFFIRIETSRDEKTWTTAESRLVQGPSATINSQQKIISTQPVHFRAAAYPLQDPQKQVAVSPVVTLNPIDIKQLIRDYYKASNAAWASSTSAGLNFWAKTAYPGLYDTDNDGWTRAAAEYLRDGYTETAKPQTIAIYTEPEFTPQTTGCEIAAPTPIAERVFRLRVTVTPTYNKADIKHNPRTWLHRLALKDGKLYGFGNPCLPQ